MRVIIHNNALNDEICFEIDDLTEENRLNILSSIHSRGWKDEDCFSEVEQCSTSKQNS